MPPHPIKKAIVSTVRLQEEVTDYAESAYIDNNYVNKDVSTICVREHLAQLGLEFKDPERLEDSTQVLRLTAGMERSELQWK